MSGATPRAIELLRGVAVGCAPSEVQGLPLELEQLGQAGTVIGAEELVERLQKATRRAIAALEEYVSPTAG
jgi:hypothetical protein